MLGSNIARLLLPAAEVMEQAVPRTSFSDMPYPLLKLMVNLEFQAPSGGRVGKAIELQNC